MVNDKMMAQMSSKDGFIAALDQSGGSTPGALRLYSSSWHNSEVATCPAVRLLSAVQ
jgi:fructose-bisphosphate aldolase class 1